MIDLTLKATAEPALYQALMAAGIVVLNTSGGSESAGYCVVDGFALDVIGKMQRNTGTQEVEGGQTVPVLVDVAGFHANLRGNFTDEQIALLPTIAAPRTPKRVWA